MSLIDVVNFFDLKQNDLNAQKEKEVLAILPETFKDFMNANDINAIHIVAYTPLFNDGDECVHTQRAHTDKWSMEDTAKTFNLCEAPVNRENIPYSIEEDFDSEYKDILHRTFGTNWQLLIVRNDKEIVVFKKPYNCEH